MDSRLFMEIGVVNTTFQTIDQSPYERWINDGIFDNEQSHVILQRLIAIKDGEDNTTIASKLSIASTLDELRNPWEVEGLVNGLYYYQKLLIPTQGHVTSANEFIYYNTEDETVYFVDSDEPSNNQSFENPLSEDSFDEIYELVRTGLNNCFYFDDYTFTMYSLVECYVLNERERINNYLKNNCSGNCEDSKELEVKADILLAAITVINNLMEKGDFFEAQRILNGLNTCGHLCKRFSKTLNGCGCGRA